MYRKLVLVCVSSLILANELHSAVTLAVVRCIHNVGV